MKPAIFKLINVIVYTLILLCSCQENKLKSVTVPFILDHNRMLVKAEIMRNDGSWRKVILWVDTGNPDFFISEELARDLGIDITESGEQAINFPRGVRIGGMPVDFNDVKSSVWIKNKWMFNAMHNDGNLPSSVLKKYHVIFDYPARKFTIAEPGMLKPKGIPSPAVINPINGIIQMDAIIDKEKYSFALDNGASFSYVPDDIVTKLYVRHPDWKKCFGASGCANIWGWWPEEGKWPIIRIPEITWGTLNICNEVIVGLPPFFRGGTDVGTNYSRKTAHPVNGFFGPNMFKSFRVEIVYSESTLYFEKGDNSYDTEFDLAGISLRPLDDGSYIVVGAVEKDGYPVVEGIQEGDTLMQIDDLRTTGATMGTVTDALRGKPGDIHLLSLIKDGKLFSVEAKVLHIL